VRSCSQATRTINTQGLPPFAKTQADRSARAANAAWEVLSDLVRKKEYDAALPFLDPLDDPWRPIDSAPRFGDPSPQPNLPRSSGYGFSYGDDEETVGEEPDDEADDTAANKARQSSEVPGTKAAEYRYGFTPTATDIDI
jgi:curved DNA-binding protein CbpA